MSCPVLLMSEAKVKAEKTVAGVRVVLWLTVITLSLLVVGCTQQQPDPPDRRPCPCGASTCPTFPCETPPEVLVREPDPSK